MRNEKSGIGESAPAGAQRKHPAGVKARQGAAPLRHLRCHLPLQGRLFAAAFQRRPCKGSCRRQPTEGCIAARRQRYPAKAGRPLPRMRRGRCSHRPAACPRRRQRGLMQASLPARAAQTSRRRKAPARCHTPPSAPAAHPPPLAGEAFLRRFPKGAPARGAVGASRLRGASPPGGRDILQNPAGPCMRRGRCSHRPASFPAAAAFSGPMKNHRPLRRLCAARKDTGKGNAAMHPSVCACGASTSPYRGGFFAAAFQRRPCKGSCRRQPTEGCIAARRQRYPANPGRALPRMRRGRCLHRPAACPRRRQRGLMQASLPVHAAQTSRRRKGPARCRTPPSPSVTPPLAGEAFLKAAAQRVRRRPCAVPLLHTCGTNRTFS